MAGTGSFLDEILHRSPTQKGADRRHRRRRRSRRRQVLRVLGVLVVVQAIVAMMVTVRSKVIRRRIEASRPAEYPWRSFEPVQLDGGEDQAKLFMRGTELYEDVIAAIDAATSRVLVETFIWVDDASGRRLRDALARAADRGVQVRVLYDWTLSSNTLLHGFFPPNVDAHPFRKTGLTPSGMHPRNLMRDHRKIFVIDDRVAYVGGFNIGDEYRDWRDSHLRIDCPAVADVENTFVDFWNANRTSRMDRLEQIAPRTWSQAVQVHRNDPGMAIFPIRGMYLEAIDRATERVWITNAYFVPDRAFLLALVEAARRGVDVRIMLPRRSNHPLTDALAHGMYERLLDGGVRVFHYEDFMVHAKTMTIDGAWTTVGTANLDRWSMLGNYEVNLEVRSAALARQMEQMYELDLESCTEVQRDVWTRRPVRMKVAERTLRRLAPLL